MRLFLQLWPKPGEPGQGMGGTGVTEFLAQKAMLQPGHGSLAMRPASHQSLHGREAETPAPALPPAPETPQLPFLDSEFWILQWASHQFGLGPA